jgi:hypothetical protein
MPAAGKIVKMPAAGKNSKKSAAGKLKKWPARNDPAGYGRNRCPDAGEI